MKNKLVIPVIGLRNIKTGLAVFLCLVSYAFAGFVIDTALAAGYAVPDFISNLISKDTAIYSCLTAVVVMGSSVSKSFRSGLSRIIGTVIGGVFGSIYIHLGGFIDFNRAAFILIPLGLIMLIYFLVLIRENDAVVIAAATYLIIVVTIDMGAPLLFSVNRVLSTAYGIVVSLCVNNFIGKPKNEEKTENE